MPLVVLRYKDPSVLPYVLSVGPDGVVPDEWRDRGWSIDTNTDPAEVVNAVLEAKANVAEQAQANPQPIRFASDAAAADGSNTPQPAAAKTAPESNPTPAEPASTEEH